MRKKERQPQLSWILYPLLAIMIVLYAISNNAVFGVISLLLIAFILVFEIKYSIKAEGLKRSVLDIGYAVGAAVVVWLLLVVFLGTAAPVDAVSSCSMLPVLHRGDLVVLHGIGSAASFLAKTHVPVINVNGSAFQNMQANMRNEFLAFFAYPIGNTSKVSYILPSGAYGIGLYSTYCLNDYTYRGRQNLFSQCIVQQQAGNLIRYNYSIGKLLLNGTTYNAVYTSQIAVGAVSVSANYSNPIIVYQTTSSDTFSGSIIHRLFAVLNASGQYYFLTKGDNNQALDIEFGNHPVNQSSVLGYVIADIPILGYVKLLLSGQILTPAGCNQVLSTG